MLPSHKDFELLIYMSTNEQGVLELGYAMTSRTTLKFVKNINQSINDWEKLVKLNGDKISPESKLKEFFDELIHDIKKEIRHIESEFKSSTIRLYFLPFAKVNSEKVTVEEFNNAVYQLFSRKLGKLFSANELKEKELMVPLNTTYDKTKTNF